VKTRCPECRTRYNVDPDALLPVDGMVRCFRCGTVFDAVAEEASAPGARRAAHELTLDEQADVPWAEDTAGTEPPFEIPDDLEPLQPTGEGALDVLDTLYEKRSRRRLVYGAIAFLLVAALGLQLAWQYRAELLQRFPALEPLCQHVECRPSVVHAPDRFRVLQRDIGPTPNEPGSLTLHMRIRNDADTPQPLPDIQLSLLDSNGSVVIRRRLAPGEYLFPAPPEGTLVAAGEVITIDLDFKDPGYLATGFEIDFL
jgi:predicted Zn finger-like uncharacterized protein